MRSKDSRGATYLCETDAAWYLNSLVHLDKLHGQLQLCSTMPWLLRVMLSMIIRYQLQVVPHMLSRHVELHRTAQTIQNAGVRMTQNSSLPALGQMRTNTRRAQGFHVPPAA